MSSSTLLLKQAVEAASSALWSAAVAAAEAGAWKIEVACDETRHVVNNFAEAWL